MPEKIQQDREEVAILVSGGIDCASAFPIFSSKRGELGVLKIGAIDDSIKKATPMGLLAWHLERFAEGRGWSTPEWTHERIEQYLKKERANINFVISSNGGTIVPMLPVFSLIKDLNDSGAETRSFTPDTAGSAAAHLFTFTAERHITAQTFWADHLASAHEKILAWSERGLRENLRRLLPANTPLDIDLLIKSSPFEDKMVIFFGADMEIFGIAKCHPSKEDLMRVFTSTTGIDPSVYPKLEKVFKDEVKKP